MSEYIEIRKDHTVFREGEIATNMYVISQGQIELTKQIRNEAVTVAILNEGEFFGEMALINQKKRTCTAIAKSNVVLKQYNQEKFAELLANNTGVSLRIIEGLAERLEQTTKRIASSLDAECV